MLWKPAKLGLTDILLEYYNFNILLFPRLDILCRCSTGDTISFQRA